MNICFEINNCKLIGKGAEGEVYLTSEGYVIKSFFNKKSADNEANILRHCENSRFFPNVLFQLSNLVIREYVPGKNLYEYLTKNKLSYNLSIEIIEFVEDLKKFKFKRINIRNAHIFIDKNEKLKVIDPRKVFSKDTPYPKDIIKILLKHQLFEQFLKHLTDYRPDLIQYWIDGYDYVSSKNKVSRYG